MLNCELYLIKEKLKRILPGNKDVCSWEKMNKVKEPRRSIEKEPGYLNNNEDLKQITDNKAVFELTWNH